MTTYTYTCSGFRAVKAAGATEAAEIFANRQARSDYGRRGYCRTLRLDCWTEDGRDHTYEAFIGKPVPGEPHATSGRNVFLVVTRVRS